MAHMDETHEKLNKSLEEVKQSIKDITQKIETILEHTKKCKCGKEQGKSSCGCD